MTDSCSEVQNKSQSIPLGAFLWQRIRQCGIGCIFGVPGDFNLALLDHIYDTEGLEWIGSTNELNAAYTADGYARTKAGAGCFVTTHGVGELSALNGVAGAMTERVKVIHVVGQTSRKMQQNRTMIHHNIGSKPDHQVFSKASKAFCTTAAILKSEETAANEIDRVLRACFVESCPVYIYMPEDMVSVPVSSSLLETPLDLAPDSDPESVTSAVDAILSVIYTSRQPGILIDSLVRQHDAITELNMLLDSLHLPLFTTVISKGIVDEDHPYFAGLYNGDASHQQVRAAFESCDTIIILGDLPSDSNTGGFTRKLPAITVYINSSDVRLAGSVFTQTPIRNVLAGLSHELDPARVFGIDMPVIRNATGRHPRTQSHITQAWLWPRLAAFFQAGDVVFGETGTTSFGLPMVKFPAGVHWITQAYYGSIGFATPAAFGADMALSELAPARHHRGRTVLVTGDGSLMLTVQEIGNMIKHGAAPIVFIINNSGYTIERAIRGAHKSYNDIVPFDYSQMLQFLGMPSEQAEMSFHRASTVDGLEAILRKHALIKPLSIQVVEIVMNMLDIPLSLMTQVGMRGPETVQNMADAGFDMAMISTTSSQPACH